MSNSNLIVLIVDDTPLIVKREAEMLKELKGIGSILEAGSYHEAITVLKETIPDIILLDIHLPDKSGIELLRALKSQYPTIAVIMLTNQGNGNYKDICKRLGADHFIDKSKDFDLIPGIIAHYTAEKS